MQARDRIVALAGIALLATACGGGGEGSGSGVAATSSASASGRQPYLAYSRCMQTHGAPFWPDPSTSITSRAPAYTITPRILAREHGPSWNAALSACAKKAPGQLPFTEAQLEVARTRLLKMTRCMRAHGYPDWPDPITNPDDVSYLPARGVNIKDPSPRLKAAGQACHLPSAP
jgi:hypothetical protein